MDEEITNGPPSAPPPTAIRRSDRHGGPLGRRTKGKYTLPYSMTLSVTTEIPHRSLPHYLPSDPRTPDANLCAPSSHAYAPPYMNRLIETVAAATVAAMNHHLAFLGLLLRSVDALDVKTFASNAPPPALLSLRNAGNDPSLVR